MKTRNIVDVVQEVVNVLDNLCRENGDSMLTGYSKSHLIGMKYLEDDHYGFESYYNEDNASIMTTGMKLKNSVVMMQTQTISGGIYYNLMSWTLSGNDCTLICFEHKNDMEKLYEQVISGDGMHLNSNNLGLLLDDISINEDNINLIKYHANDSRNISANYSHLEQPVNPTADRINNFQMH